MSTDTMASTRPVVINEVLCFLLRKKGRFAEKSIKLRMHFYSSDIITTAKTTLFEAALALKIDGCPTIRRHRESKEMPDAKTRADIDDLIALTSFLDDNKACDKLPIFVAADPDLLPSPRLLEGDLLVFMNKLNLINERCSKMQKQLDANRALLGTLGPKFQVGGHQIGLTNKWPLLPSGGVGHTLGVPSTSIQLNSDEAVGGSCSSARDSEGEQGHNIDATYTAKDVQQYAEHIGMRVISCFERIPQDG